MMTTRIPTNQDDVIDSRDVIEALRELAKLHTPGPVELDLVWECEVDDVAQDELFYHESLLLALAKEASDYAADWEYGETLIRDSYFKDYVMELADEIGVFQRQPDRYSTGKGEDLTNVWPFSCIDWEQAARELQMDYTSVDFDGITYWVR